MQENNILDLSSYEDLTGPSKNCFICGKDNPYGLKVCFKEQSSGVVVAEFIPSDHLNGFKGVLHGGIISAGLDDIMDWAIYSRTGKWFVTTQMTINFKKSAPVLEKLRLKGWVTREDGSLPDTIDHGKIKRIQFARAELTTLSGDLLASSEGKFFQIPEDKIREIIL
jgi:acyl-coenzyme A thioesterase PaaI-like protein